MLSQKIVKKIHDWKPISEFFTGILGVLVSCLALVISLYAVYASSSSPELTAHPGRHFGIAILRGNHLQDWDLPDFDYPTDERWLVMDLAIVVANAGGKRGVIDHMELEIQNLGDLEAVNLEWKLYFIEPTSRDLEKRPELVTPLVVEGSSSQKKLVRFAAPTPAGLLPKYFKEGEKYSVSLKIHRAESGTPITELEESFSLVWEIDDYASYNINLRDYAPSSKPKSGETALLTFF